MPRLDLLSGHSQGSDAEVYRARGVTADGRAYQYAARRLPRAAASPKLYQALVASQRALARVTHANLVRSFGVALPEGDDDSGDLYVLSELLDCRDAHDVLAVARSRRHTVPLGAALHIARCLCAALEHVTAKTQGAHGAITPRCVLLCVGGEVKLAELGVARHTRAHTQTRKGCWYGPLAYAAPEQLDSDDADALSDVYQVGLVLYELLAGAPLFSGRNEGALVEAMLRHEVPALPRAHVPAVLDELVHVVLSRNPQLRPLQLGLELAAIARGRDLELTECATDVAALVAATAAPSLANAALPVRGLRAQELRASGVPVPIDAHDPTGEVPGHDTDLDSKSARGSSSSKTPSQVPDDAPTARSTRVPNDLRHSDATSLGDGEPIDGDSASASARRPK